MWQLLVTSALGGVGRFITGNIAAKRERAANLAQAKLMEKQADDLTNSIWRINTFVEEGKIDPEEGVARFAALMDATSEEMRAAAKLGIEATMRTLDKTYGDATEELSQNFNDFLTIMEKKSKTYRSDWKEGMDKLSDDLIRGRLARTEFGSTLKSKEIKKLQEGEKEISEEIAKVTERFGEEQVKLAESTLFQKEQARTKATAALTAQMAQFGLQKGMGEEQIRERGEAINRALAQFGLTETEKAKMQQSLLRGGAEITRAGELPKATTGFLGGMEGLFGGGGMSGIGGAALTELFKKWGKA